MAHSPNTCSATQNSALTSNCCRAALAPDYRADRRPDSLGKVWCSCPPLDDVRIFNRWKQHRAPALLLVYPGAQVYSPSQNATVSSPFQILAGATISIGYLAAVRVCVDNLLQVIVDNPQQTKSFAIKESLAIARGTHSVVVVGYPAVIRTSARDANAW